MRCDALRNSLHNTIPAAVRVPLIALGWLLLISLLHYQLNFQSKGSRPIVHMGYMPVITNMAAPLLDYASQKDTDIRFSALKFASFAEMAEALRDGNIEAAFIIAPLAIVLKQQGEDVKVVYIGNRHESTLVARADLQARSISDLAGRTVAVPMRYSGHNLSLRQLAESNHLGDTVKIVEMNPPDMPAALISGSLDAYFVGEPFAARTLQNGQSHSLFYVEDIWPDFICNVMLVKQSFIDAHPKLVEQLVQGAVRSGLWAQDNLASAAEIAASYWNQSPELVTYALTTPKHNRVVFDRYTPKADELKQMAKLMVHYKLSQSDDIEGLVDDRFAQEASLYGIEGIDTILPPTCTRTANP